MESTPSSLKRTIKNRTADYFFIKMTACLEYSSRHLAQEIGISGFMFTLFYKLNFNERMESIWNAYLAIKSMCSNLDTFFL
jgi:hypothetical protein